MRLLVVLTMAMGGCTPEHAAPAPLVPAAPAATMGAAPAHAIFPPPRTVLGTATMLADGTIVLDAGHAILRYPPGDPNYAATLAHIGKLSPGEPKTVAPFPDDIDDAKVEAAVRAHVAKRGIDASTCTGDVSGTDSEKNVLVAVRCGETGLVLLLRRGSYEVAPRTPR